MQEFHKTRKFLQLFSCFLLFSSCVMHNVLWVFNTATSSYYGKLELRVNTDAASIEDVEKWVFDGNCGKYLHILWTKSSPSALSNFLSIAQTNNDDDDVVAAEKNTKAWNENPFNEKSNSSNWRLRELKFHLKREFSSLQCCTCESSAKLIECFSSLFKWKSEKKRFTSAATSSTGRESELAAGFERFRFPLKLRN